MLIIGLTGGIGCGKTTVSNYFASLQAKIIDADLIVRNLLSYDQNVIQTIIEHFGTKVILQNNTKPQHSIDSIRLDKKSLRQIIFSDNDAKIWLEKFLHPLVYQNIHKQIEELKNTLTQSKQNHPKYCIVVIPLLYETLTKEEYKKLFDRILVVVSDENLQISRTMSRDSVQQQEVEAILKHQTSNQERIQLADDIIYNNSDLENLHQQIDKLHVLYGNL